jgi:hypothetical protein
LERGEGGFEHWQFVVSFAQKISLSKLRRILPGTGHYERTRSTAAADYCNKPETRIGEPFQFGTKSFQRNSVTDWDAVRAAAIANKLSEIPSDIFIRYYGALRSIAADFSEPVGIEKHVQVYYGPTGTGKSRRAFAEAGLGCYFKDPRSKFWCGYKAEENVIVDEFRGAIDISHILRWTDRYPVRVEVKGSSKPLAACRIWFTSNLHPKFWYPDLDADTYAALERRINIVLID